VQVPVRRPRNVETTAMGAAFAAGLAVGVWERPADLTSLNPADAEFTPAITPAECDARLDKWKDAVQRTLGLAK
jgi:glycerol kinase